MAESHGSLARFTKTVSLIFFLSCLSLSNADSLLWKRSNPNVYTNDFVVTMRSGSSYASNLAHAQYLAKRHGFENHGTVADDANTFHFRHRSIDGHSTSPSYGRIWPLSLSPKVKRVSQMTGYGRLKRGYKKKNSYKGLDPLYGYQWYINNTGQAGGIAGLDLNVQEAWDLGITGKGVTVAIMDDGLDYLHPDLKDNYSPESSYDFSSNDPFPYPRYTLNWFNSHGTRCAGEVSSIADNGICGVGVAYDSKIAGIRMLDQPYMTDVIEAKSMSYRSDINDIYSASWGPTDDGKTVDGPRELTMRAIVNGIAKGRDGKGSIFVWASGDGGAQDDCNCDGYAASMWTISINSAINDGETALYDEACSSTLASTLSNGRRTTPGSGVATTDLYGQCTLRHSGTSAAAPEAAGVFALALEANKNLTWRDMQHLTVLTSSPHLLHDSEHPWQTNGAGFKFNHLFGFGVLDAGQIVRTALNWQPLPTRFRCEERKIQDQVYEFSSEEPLVITIPTNACKGTQNQVNFVEHVQVFATIEATRRGDVTINLISPSGTKSMLLSRRSADEDSTTGFKNWPFMTTQTWGEQPQGTWKLQFEFRGDSPQKGVVSKLFVVFHGVKTKPYPDEIYNHFNLVRPMD